MRVRAAARLAARRWWLAAILVAAPLAACGGGQAERPSVSVGMFDNFYARDVTRVPAGTPVVFENKGYAPHNAVAVGGAFRTQQTIDAEQSATVVASLPPGVYRYYCTFHATPDARDGMVATLVVGDVPYDPGKGERGTGVAPVAKASGVTRSVPEDYRTIQLAVNAAKPGDLVLVGPGVYREEVKVRTPSLVLRGRDRNTVIVDGEFKRANAISVTADGVAVENLTVRNAKVNGVFWTGVKGYRASYVTAVNNEVYGIYAFDATDGLFERSWASGSYDAGFYIGQCKPCDAVIDGVTSESNGLGYTGTNAGGNLHIVRSVWRHNVGGIVPNTLDTELLPPFKGVDVVGNLVEGNGSRTAPARGLQWSSFGNGIILAGGDDSRVERNLILNHPNHGVLVTPNTDRRFWISSGNRVRDNLVRGSGRADLALSGPAGPGNCFAGNDVRSTLPVGLEFFQPCRGLRLPVRMDFSTALHSLGSAAEGNTDAYPHIESRDVPPPPPQPGMPGGASAPVRPAVNVYTGLHLDLDAIALPAWPAGLEVTTRKEPTMFGVPILASSAWQLVFGLYGYVLPFVLYAAWTSLALWDLARREDLGRAATIAWILVVLVVPFLGVVAYHVAGRPKLPGWLRLTVLAGGIAAYLIVLAVGAWMGGIA
ncbi:MAG TPA: PLDc N-terminal domain-containing protein [Actinomycetota bacterium]|nr:PLDc N-terminal domain-containing protein [Actinomycetota bacterium]